MVNSNSIFNTKYAKFSTKCQILLHFYNCTCAYNHPYKLFQESVPLLQPIFTSAIFYLTIFAYKSQQSTIKIFSLPQTFSQFRLGEEVRELGSFVRPDTVLISPFFLKIWTVISGLTTTYCLSPRLRKLVYCKQQSLRKMLAIRMANHPIHVPLYPQTIVITSIPY